jgi:hypothetical protein
MILKLCAGAKLLFWATSPNDLPVAGVESEAAHGRFRWIFNN